MKKVLIVKNITREGPGLLKKILANNGVNFEVIDLDVGDTLPDLATYDAIIVLGGPSSANSNIEKITQLIEVTKTALDSNIPYFGICLGMQILVKASGGNIVKSPSKEIGFKDQMGKYYEIVKEKDDAILKNVSFPRPIFHLHEETVELTKDMELITSGKWCKNQLVKVKENAYGIQGHLELTKEILENWISKDSDLKTFDQNALISDYSFIKKRI